MHDFRLNSQSAATERFYAPNDRFATETEARMAARTCAVGAPSRAATDRIRWRNAADGHQQLQWADLPDGLGRGTSLRGNNPGMRSRLVFLVPGFFGFTSIGAISYFERVEQTLRRALRRHGIEARIHRCRTQPTASIPQRVDALRRQVMGRGGLEATDLHFVGHSTGGLHVARADPPRRGRALHAGGRAHGGDRFRRAWHSTQPLRSPTPTARYAACGFFQV